MAQPPVIQERQNQNFVQLSKTYMRDYRALIRKSPLAAEVLMFLVERMGKTTNAVVASPAVLEEVTGMSRSSVNRALKILKDENWMDVVKIGGIKTYAVNERVVWSAQANARKYAIFSATVIATESEQDRDVTEKAPPLKNIPIVGEIENDRLIIANDPLPPPDQGEIELD